MTTSEAGRAGGVRPLRFAVDEMFAVESAIVEPVTGPALEAPVEADPVVTPRLARHQIPLTDGHVVGISVCGRGIPLVVVHGYGAEGFLYAQTLSRLSSMGFKVIAIDTAGHGGTQSVPYRGGDLGAYSQLLADVVDELGIRSGVFAGHSMGGRLVTELAAAQPDRVAALILVDAIVGDTWDQLVKVMRFVPPMVTGFGAVLAADALSCLPLVRDPRQALKLGRLVVPTVLAHVVQPWRLVAPAISILRTQPSRVALDALAAAEVPVFVLHGDRDLAVPLRAGADTARRTHGTLVTIRRGGHSWLLRDPETLPAVMADLLDDGLGQACRRAAESLGVTSEHPTDDEIESVFYEPGARILALSPSPGVSAIAERHRRPAFRWSTSAHETAGGTLHQLRPVVDDDGPAPPQG